MTVTTERRTPTSSARPTSTQQQQRHTARTNVQPETMLPQDGRDPAAPSSAWSPLGLVPLYAPSRVVHALNSPLVCYARRESAAQDGEGVRSGIGGRSVLSVVNLEDQARVEGIPQRQAGGKECVEEDAEESDALGQADDDGSWAEELWRRVRQGAWLFIQVILSLDEAGYAEVGGATDAGVVE